MIGSPYSFETPIVDDMKDSRPRMLFVRNYKSFTGGHMKYCDYIKHVVVHGSFHPLLHVTKDSNTEELNTLLPSEISLINLPCHADAIFVAGMDWEVLDASGQNMDNVPIINLIQGTRHADPSLRLFEYLSRPAIRICVSQEVANAIMETKRVNGPVFVIENGTDLSTADTIEESRRNGKVFIGGLKDPVFAKSIASELGHQGIRYDLSSKRIPRADYLAQLANYDHAILLPLPSEGFYLPALEAMALGVTVIMPDCVGARSFAVSEKSCLIAQRNLKPIIESVIRVINDTELTSRLRAGGHAVCRKFDIATERQKFLSILENNLL